MVIPVQLNVQDIDTRNLYGIWENTGSFRDGEQQLVALKDTLQNPKKYYFTFYKNGTFTYDVVSPDPKLSATRRGGKWQLSPNRKRITLRDNQVDPEKRQIPADFLHFETDGSLSSKPMIYPILELTPNKLVLYDEYHKTLDIFRRQ